MTEKLFKDIYGDEICNIAAKEPNGKLVFRPDLTVEGLGHNCGDKISYRLRIKNNTVEIEPKLEACILAKASMIVLLDKIHEKPLAEVEKICVRGLNYIRKGFNGQSEDGLSCFKSLGFTRKSCIELPWTLMESALREIKNNLGHEEAVASTEVRGRAALECDACVATSAIQATSQPTKKEKKYDSFFKIMESIFIDKDNQDVIQSDKKAKQICGIDPYVLGKAVVNAEELKALEKLLENWDDEFMVSLEHARMEGVVSSHIENKLHRNIPEKLQEYLDFRIKHRQMKIDTWNQVNKVLLERGIPFSIIKGLITHKYYEELGINRDFRDLDILVPTMEQFFEVANILKFEFGFEYYDELGLAGSLRELEGSRLSGHAHLMRFTDSETVISIDVVFPNITSDHSKLLLEDISYSGGGCEDSNLLLIAMTHAFKHTRPPVNDINDIYVLYRRKQINWDYLVEKIKLNGLEFKAEAIRRVLIKWFGVPSSELERMNMCSELTWAEKRILTMLMDKGWPYSWKSHKLFIYINKLRMKDKGLSKLLYSYKNIKPSPEKIEKFVSRSYEENGREFVSFIKSKGGKRVFVIPIVSFAQRLEINKYYDLLQKKCDKLERISSNIYFINMDSTELMVTESGIFVFTNDFEVSQGLPEMWSLSCERLLKYFEMNIKDYSLRFAYDSKNGIWVYS